MALATSFDGCSVLRGAEHKQPFADSWLHVDENLAQTQHADYSVQCAVNLEAGRPSTHGAFVCVPRSHTLYKKLYADMKVRSATAQDVSGDRKLQESKSEDKSDDAEMKRFTASKSHYVPLPSASCAMLRPFCNSSGAVQVVALAVEAGDMVSWMSTLTHANTPPTAKPPKKTASRMTSSKKMTSTKTTSKKAAPKETNLKKAPNADGKEGVDQKKTTTSKGDCVVMYALRRVAAFVSMYPKNKLAGFKANPDEWLARRQAACAAAFTAGHDPVNPAENNVSRRGRHPAFSKIVTPSACRKTLFTPTERDLL